MLHANLISGAFIRVTHSFVGYACGIHLLLVIYGEYVEYVDVEIVHKITWNDLNFHSEWKIYFSSMFENKNSPKPSVAKVCRLPFGRMHTKLTNSLEKKRNTPHEWVTLDRVHVIQTYYIFHFYFHLSPNFRLTLMPGIKWNCMHDMATTYKRRRWTDYDNFRLFRFSTTCSPVSHNRFYCFT